LSHIWCLFCSVFLSACFANSALRFSLLLLTVFFSLFASLCCYPLYLSGFLSSSFCFSFSLVAREPPPEAPKNDYSQHYVDTGLRPQNYVRDAGPEKYQEYPRLQELVTLTNQLVAERATPPMYINCDLKTFDLTQLGTKFDVILIDPPWEEYRSRCPSAVVQNMNREVWTFEEIMNLRIDLIAHNPSFIFLWCGSMHGLQMGRQLLHHWGFRRCEDIVWVKTNKTKGGDVKKYVYDGSVLQHTTEHCLMGIKGTVVRSKDHHIIHANIDTDVIISEEPEYGSTEKPVELYEIIEHFAMGRRRIELFGEMRNIRPGWVTLGNQLPGTNYSKEAYLKYFEGKDGHLLGTTPRIEELRPKSPEPKKGRGVSGRGRVGSGGFRPVVPMASAPAPPVLRR